MRRKGRLGYSGSSRCHSNNEKTFIIYFFRKTKELGVEQLFSAKIFFLDWKMKYRIIGPLAKRLRPKYPLSVIIVSHPLFSSVTRPFFSLVNFPILAGIWENANLCYRPTYTTGRPMSHWILTRGQPTIGGSSPLERQPLLDLC